MLAVEVLRLEEYLATERYSTGEPDFHLVSHWGQITWEKLQQWNSHVWSFSTCPFGLPLVSAPYECPVFLTDGNDDQQIPSLRARVPLTAAAV